MADTQRTSAALAALFADNTSGDISPQDLRDFLESATPSFGGCYVSTPAATTLTVNNWALAAGTSTATGLHRFTHNNANRLTYTGTADVHCHIVGSYSMTCAANNQVVELGVALNGTIDTASILARKVGTGSDLGSAASHTDVMLSTGDYLELFVRNTTDSNNVTIEHGYLFAMGMLS